VIGPVPRPGGGLALARAGGHAGGVQPPDEVVAALARSGGSVWVSFNRSDLLAGAPDDEALDRLVRHIEALVQRLGENCVGIGTDLQAGGRYVPAPLNRDDASP